jgi:hypothetical protein
VNRVITLSHSPTHSLPPPPTPHTALPLKIGIPQNNISNQGHFRYPQRPISHSTSIPILTPESHIIPSVPCPDCRRLHAKWMAHNAFPVSVQGPKHELTATNLINPISIQSFSNGSLYIYLTIFKHSHCPYSLIKLILIVQNSSRNGERSATIRQRNSLKFSVALKQSFKSYY